MRGLPLLLLVVALAPTALSGCGSDTNAANDYVDAVNRAQNGFAATFDRLSGHITSTSSPSEDRKTLGRFKRAVDKVVADLRAIDVPGDVGPLHDRLIGEISTYGKEIDKAKAAFAGDDPQAIIKAQTDLVSAVTRVSGQINRTIDAINRKLRE